MHWRWGVNCGSSMRGLSFKLQKNALEQILMSAQSVILEHTFIWVCVYQIARSMDTILIQLMQNVIVT